MVVGIPKQKLEASFKDESYDGQIRGFDGRCYMSTLGENRRHP
jgi:hypothetical protein